MSWAYRFYGTIEGSGLPIASSCGEITEMRKLNDDAYFEENKVRFNILDTNGNPLVSGAYVGAERDRGFVLDSVRLFTRSLDVDPVRVEYDDGSAWVFDSKFGATVKEAS